MVTEFFLIAISHFWFYSKVPHPKYRRKYLRVYSEPLFNDDPVFASMVRDFISSHSEFLPRSMNSEFPNLETYICFWIGDTTCFITYLESWLKDDSGHIPEYFLRCSRVGLFGKSSEKMASYHWQPTVLFKKKQSSTTTTTISSVSKITILLLILLLIYYY